MSGGVTQLIVNGQQDTFITGNPEVSFFQSVYKRHTNFAQIVSRQIIQGAPNAGSVSTIRFEKKGDLMSHVFLTKRNGKVLETFEEADNDIKYIEILINGQVIDTQYSDFMFNIADLLASTPNRAIKDQGSLKFFPLHFWFCESWQSALPLINLINSDVEIRINWNTPNTSRTYECFANYIYLDDAERQSMKKNTSSQFLIYQVQRQSASGLAIQPLIFNNPVKFLAASSNITSETALIKFQMNGVDIGDEKIYDQHYNQIPHYYNSYFDTGAAPEFLHTFCLDTSKIQPSGSVNFSRVDSARLITDGAAFNFSDYIYAVNYNVLKVQNGIGALMYCN
jgi:hypothetical protein